MKATLLVAGGCATLISCACFGSVSAADDTPPAFAATSSASGMQLNVTIPGFPLADAPVDINGPIAQVALNSSGDSHGFAAFPAMGTLPDTAPGLAAGIVGQQVPGLPEVPTAPVQVSSDAHSTPEASAGTSPYILHAKSSETSSSASAIGGFDIEPSGALALVRAQASVGPDASSDIVDTATTTAQGLTIGPMKIADVTSTATQTLRSDGTATPSSHLEVTGASVNGVAVSITPEGVRPTGLASNALTDVVDAGLKSAGMTVRLVEERRYPTEIIAPALVVSFPFSMPARVPQVGQFAGTGTVTLGGASAKLEPGLSDAIGSVGGIAGTEASGTGGAAPSATSAFSDGISSSTRAGGSRPSPVVRPLGAVTRAVGVLDVRVLYGLLAFGALTAFGLGQGFRILGVRRTWTSGPG
jgi:hypothetical protein